MSEDAELIDFDEVLKILSVSPERLENLVIAGELPAFRHGRAIRFRRQDVAEYLTQRGGPGGARLEGDDRKAKAVAAKIASLRRSRADGASALLEKLGAGEGKSEELVSLKERIEGRGAGAARPEQILVEFQKELSIMRRRADEAEKQAGELEDERQKLLAQLQFLDSLREEVKQVALLARENDELRKKLSGREADVEAAQRTAQLERERDRFKEQLKGAEDALAALQERASEGTSLRAEKRVLEQKLAQAREEARASLFVPPEEHVQRAVARADELASERNKLIGEIEELRKQAGRLEARLSAVEGERDGAVRKLKETETSLKAVPAKDEELDRLQTELEDARKELESAREEAASGLKSENESLRSELAEIRDKFASSSRAEGQLEEMRAEVENLRLEREELREELRGAQVTLGHMRADAGQSKQRGKELEEARNEVKELRKEYDQFSARVLAAESARDEAQKEAEEAEEAERRASELESEVLAASAALEEARAELDSVGAVLEEEKERSRGLEEEREAETGALKEEMEALQASLAEAQAAAANAGEMNSLRAELEGARTRASNLARELEEAKERLQAAAKPEELDSLREELEEARSRSSRLEGELQEAKAQIEAAAGPEVLESARTELEEARSRSSQLEGELEDAKERLQGAARTKRVKKLESELEIVRSRAQELEGKLAEAETSTEEADQLRERLEGVSAELESTRTEREKALGEVAALKASAGESDEFRARLDELSAQLAGARKDSDAHRLELSRKEGALAALQAQLEKARNAEEEAKGLMGQLAELREKLARVEGEAEPLRKRRAQLAGRLRAEAPGPPSRRPTVIMVGGGPLPPGAPERVGRFTLVGVIGGGRKGSVFTASSPYAAGAAAVRILSEELLGDSRFMEHFLPRIRRVAELENKSIVDVLDTGEFPGGYFVATELLDGGSLRERLHASGRINPDETLAIIMQLTKALEVARRAGLVHRDIRPENILFTRDGTPKLSDLGLSLGTSEDGCSAGKGWARHYAAPEQVRGEDVDCRADVFSLGTVAYEMLTGAPVFQAATRDGAANLYDSVVLDRPDCSPGLALVVARMLCKSPDNRYAAPKDLATDLILLSEGAEPRASAPGEEESFVRASG